MRRAILLVCVACMACGADSGPTPPADGGGDAAADAAADAPTGVTPRCVGTGRLDCDGNGTCETPRNDPMNCGACGRACIAPRFCSSLGDCL